MGFKFRKRVSLFGGLVNLNIGKNGLNSLSIGAGPLTYNTKSKKTTVNIPGSGLSYQTEGEKKGLVIVPGDVTRATVSLPVEDMELIRRYFKVKSNKAAVEMCVKMTMDTIRKFES